MTTVSVEKALAAFRELHERGRRGELRSAEDRVAYERVREDFGWVLAIAHRAPPRWGQSAWHSVRVPMSLDVLLTQGNRRESTSTLNIGVRGFTTLVADFVDVGSTYGFRLQLPAGPVDGRARLAGAKRQDQVAFRASFELEALRRVDQERLEACVLDAAFMMLP